MRVTDEARTRLPPSQPTVQLSLVFPPSAVSSQLKVPARCAAAIAARAPTASAAEAAESCTSGPPAVGGDVARPSSAAGDSSVPPVRAAEASESAPRETERPPTLLLRSPGPARAALGASSGLPRQDRDGGRAFVAAGFGFGFFGRRLDFALVLRPAAGLPLLVSSGGGGLRLWFLRGGGRSALASSAGGGTSALASSAAAGLRLWFFGRRRWFGVRDGGGFLFYRRRPGGFRCFVGVCAPGESERAEHRENECSDAEGAYANDPHRRIVTYPWHLLSLHAYLVCRQ